MSNDTLNSRIQLNASADESFEDIELSTSTSNPTLLPRELYLYPNDKHIYMYVGVPSSTATDESSVRVAPVYAKVADTVKCSWNANGVDKSLTIYKSSIYGGVLASNGVNSANKRRRITIADGTISSAWSSTEDAEDPNRAYGYMTHMSIGLCAGNGITYVAKETNEQGEIVKYPYIDNIQLLNIPRLTLIPKDLNTNTRNFGYELPTTAQYGEVFFKLVK